MKIEEKIEEKALIINKKNINIQLIDNVRCI